MTLRELLRVIGDYGDEMIQLCNGDEWNEYDTFHADSLLLKPFYNLRVIAIAAIKENVFRVDLDLDGLESEEDASN